MTSKTRALIFGITLLLSLAVGTDALAQRTGRRFGSSSFGGSSRSSSSSSRSSWSSSRSGSSSSSSSRSSSRPAPPRSALRFAAPVASSTVAVPLGSGTVTPAEEAARVNAAGVSAFSWAGCCASPVALFGLVMLSWVVGRKREAPVVSSPAASGAFEARRVSIAFDWSVRRGLQAALDHLAETLPLDSSEGRRAGARAVATSLAQHLSGARYATFQALRVTPEEVEGRFSQLALDLAARYQHEHDAVPGELRARADEGEGLVVVSMLVATDAWMTPLPPRMDHAAVHEALGTLAAITTPSVLALEVIWSPAAEQDRLSSLELEGIYPELQRLDAAVALGRVSCGYCSAPYPAELGRCPACGAPR